MHLVHKEVSHCIALRWRSCLEGGVLGLCTVTKAQLLKSVPTLVWLKCPDCVCLAIPQLFTAFVACPKVDFGPRETVCLSSRLPFSCSVTVLYCSLHNSQPLCCSVLWICSSTPGPGVQQKEKGALFFEFFVHWQCIPRTLLHQDHNLVQSFVSSFSPRPYYLSASHFTLTRLLCYPPVWVPPKPPQKPVET